MHHRDTKVQNVNTARITKPISQQISLEAQSLFLVNIDP